MLPFVRAVELERAWSRSRSRIAGRIPPTVSSLRERELASVVIPASPSSPIQVAAHARDEAEVVVVDPPLLADAPPGADPQCETGSGYVSGVCSTNCEKPRADAPVVGDEVGDAKRSRSLVPSTTCIRSGSRPWTRPSCSV